MSDGAGVIPAARVRALLDSGRARALLAEDFPVPVEIDGRWWHVPAAAGGGEGEEFVPAPEPLAAEFARLAVRLEVADRAVRRVDRRRSV